MQISKSLSVLCAVALILPMAAREADTPEQARAREALRQAYDQAGTQAAPLPFSSGDSEGIAKARAALRGKMNELEAQTAPGAPGFSEGQELSVGFSEVATSPRVDPAVIEAARTAVRHQFDIMPHEPVSTKPLDHPEGGRQYQPLEGPPLPFSVEKQGKLAELLRRYRADEITPEQYHAERAKIIAGP
jgi:hypothetical protein